jgi:hypothetical protein
VERYRIDLVLSPPDAPIAASLREQAGWTVVDSDKSAVLLAPAH